MVTERVRKMRAACDAARNKQAKDALAEYLWANDEQDALTDLLTDLRHAYGNDMVETAIYRSEYHYRAEQEDSSSICMRKTLITIVVDVPEHFKEARQMLRLPSLHTWLRREAESYVNRIMEAHSTWEMCHVEQRQAQLEEGAASEKQSPPA